MHNPFALDSQTQYALDVLGAEPLAGSGFENEQTDPTSTPTKFAERRCSCGNDSAASQFSGTETRKA